MGSIIGQKIDYNGVGALSGQRHIPSKHKPKYPPPPARVGPNANSKGLVSEISRGGRWKTGEVYSFLSPPKGRVMKKMTGKEGGSHKISHHDREGMLQYYALRE